MGNTDKRVSLGKGGKGKGRVRGETPVFLRKLSFPSGRVRSKTRHVTSPRKAKTNPSTICTASLPGTSHDGTEREGLGKSMKECGTEKHNREVQLVKAGGRVGGIQERWNESK